MSVELIAELNASQNLNTTPFTVSNIEGDKYDYHFIVFCDSADTTAGNLDITLNSDTGNNYERYYMRGSTSTASASVVTSVQGARLTNFTRNQTNRNSLCIGPLTGQSGVKRKFETFFSSGHTPQIYIYDHYWTNTVDEVTSMTFTGSVSASYTWHIMVYRVPKVSDHGRWEHMADLSWSAESTEKSFTGLDGDTDIQYRIVWDGDQFIDVELNNDGTASNYQRQWLYNNGGTLTAGNATDLIFIKEQGELLINAESGVDRLVYQGGSHTSGTVQNQASFWWQNTASNLTSLDLTPSASATGTAKLYRRINTATTADPLPFETIKTIDVSGDYSAGTTISGLALDQYKLVKIEWLGTNTSGSTNIQIQFNSDTGSNYTRQTLSGLSSTASAASATETFIYLCVPQNAEQSWGVSYIYPKSGEYRPVLNSRCFDEDQIQLEAQWWLNSASEITSIKTFASNTNSLTGKIIISVLR